MKKSLGLILSIVLLVTITFTSLGFATIAVKSIKLDTNNVSLQVGKTYKLKVSFTPANTTQKLLNFSTGNKNIAIVDQNGNIKAIGVGKTVITVVSSTNKKVLAKCNVNVEKRWTFSWRLYPAAPVNKDTPTEKYLENLFDININVVMADDQKLGAMIAAGETPELMFLSEPSLWQPLAAQGILAELPMEIIKQNAPKHYQRINEVDPRMWGVSSYNGKTYTIPQEAGNQEFTLSCIWRKDWLDKLGITKVPDTIKEFEDAFVAIRNNDPDENGKKDTYGLTGQGGHSVRQFDYIFGAFGIMPGQWKVTKGKVMFGTIANEAKEALILLNNWYKLGIIDPEFITDNPTTTSAKWGAERYGVDFSTPTWYTMLTPGGKSTLEYWEKKNPKAKFVFGPLPAGPKGNRGSWLWGPRKNFVGISSRLNKRPDKIARLIQIMQEINYNEEVAMRVTWGEKGKHYDYNDPKVGASSGLKYLEPYASDINFAVKEGIRPLAFNLFQPLTTWAASEITDKYVIESVFKDQIKYANSKQSRDALCRPYLRSALQYQGNLDKLKVTAFSEFITGARSLSTWDKFVEQWLNEGGKILTDEAQKLYDENMKAFDKDN